MTPLSASITTFLHACDSYGHSATPLRKLTIPPHATRHPARCMRTPCFARPHSSTTSHTPAEAPLPFPSMEKTSTVTAECTRPRATTSLLSDNCAEDLSAKQHSRSASPMPSTHSPCPAHSP